MAGKASLKRRILRELVVKKSKFFSKSAKFRNPLPASFVERRQKALAP
jgi:hypothetical protein